MLALLAGTGALPTVLADALPEKPLVCALDGFAPDDLHPDITYRLETVGSLLAELKARGVTDVVMAGAIRRPQVDPSRIDAATLPLVPVLQAALAASDDAALGAVIGLFETAGFAVRAAHEIAPSLLPAAGVLGQVHPEDSDRSDAARGLDALAKASAADIGQSCAVKAGQVLAFEAIFGTAWMLHSLQQRPDGAGGVFCKAPKRGQERRADLPTIGVDTVAQVAQAGLRGLVLEAGGVMVLNLAEVVAACDAAGLFLWVQEPRG